MAHTLTFSSIHKSITQLDPTTLPSFTVLTGRNGSGKTHLLTAIRDGKIASTIVQDHATDVRFFDWGTIVPKDTGAFDPWGEQSKRAQWFLHVQNQRTSAFPALQQYVVGLGVPVLYCSSLGAVHALTTDRLRLVLAEPLKADEVNGNILARLRQFGVEVGQHAINNIGDEYWRRAAPRIMTQEPESFALLSQSEFFKSEHFLWGEVDPFQQAFGKVFATYRELMHENALLKEFPPQSGSRKHVSQAEFTDTHGEAPWSFVNQILEECKLDFRVDNPLLHETGAYEPKLTKVTSGVEMKFEDLSSGEKVLMSFALCLYNTEDKRQAKVFPKLLLLDEVDAPLHPSMTVSLLKTIQNVLVESKNVAVILTTHSPSTVALAPEGSIFAMNPDGPRIEKIQKSAALSLLTTGVPTLAISFSGRRQVFVESNTDAELYDALYQRYKGHIAAERSLVFVEVGRRDALGGEKNAGCEQVLRLVSDLSNGGNQSVLGLVDWDGGRVATDRVHVLSSGRRDGLESLLFDPVLLLSLVVREDLSFAQTKGLIAVEEAYINLSSWDVAKWQSAIDAIQTFVLGCSTDAQAVQTVDYLNGMSLSIRNDYLTCDDHDLEAKITKAFGFLIPKNRRAGDLMKYVNATVLSDFPNLLPRDLLVTFEALLNVELS